MVTLVLNSWQQDNALSEWILEVIADDWSSETIDLYRDCPGAKEVVCPKAFCRGSFDRAD